MYIGQMDVYERIGDNLYRGHETLQLMGQPIPARCFCGKVLTSPVWGLHISGTAAFVDDCDECGPRRPERYIDMRAPDGEMWHSVDRGDLGHTLCGEKVGSDWIFYRPTGRPHGASRCVACEGVRTEAARQPNVVLRGGPLDGHVGYVEQPRDRQMLRHGLRLYGYVPNGEVDDSDPPLVVLVHNGESKIAPTDV